MIRIFMLLCLLGLSACETVKGVGRDITRAAETVDRL
ncbi:MAG: entericidin, EcnA/B family [Yoonia sp.]|nr:entericidin, EcnA/B family [Yoonia sp.]